MSCHRKSHQSRHSRTRRRRSMEGLILMLLISGSALAQEAPPAPSSTEEIIEEILKLRRRIDALLEALPPELRDEVERRWPECQQTHSSSADTEPPFTDPAAGMPAVERPTLEELAQPAAPARVSAASSDSAPAPDAPATCGTLAPLDSSQDGLVSASDRYWRYLRLWLDDGNSELEPTEIASLFELGIRQIDVDMTAFKDGEDRLGDIDVDEVLELRLHAKGRSGTRTGVLIIEAGRLARGEEIWLVDAAGTRLTDYQLLTTELAFELSNGRRHPLACP